MLLRLYSTLTIHPAVLMPSFDNTKHKDKYAGVREVQWYVEQMLKLEKTSVTACSTRSQPSAEKSVSARVGPRD